MSVTHSRNSCNESCFKSHQHQSEVESCNNNQSIHENDSHINPLDYSHDTQKLLLLNAFEDLYKTVDQFDRILKSEFTRKRSGLRIKVFNNLWSIWLDKRVIDRQKHLDRLPVGCTAEVTATGETFIVFSRTRHTDTGGIYVWSDSRSYLLHEVDCLGWLRCCHD